MIDDARLEEFGRRVLLWVMCLWIGERLLLAAAAAACVLALMQIGG